VSPRSDEPAADPRPRVAVIGAGVGGLTCALRLAHTGCHVTIFERNERVGGKLNVLLADGFAWDMGPSLLTMPQVFDDLFASLGRQRSDYVKFIPLPCTCRYRWADGTTIEEDESFWRRDDVARFLGYAAGLYELSADAFLNHPPEDWWRHLNARFVPKLRHLPKIASRRTMAQTVRHFFPDDLHLQQLFNRFATYNGSSPYRTPSAFNIIPYVQARFGGWYVKGGMYAIARALVALCGELGVEIRLNSEIKRAQWRDRRWLLNNTESFDYVVCNQDVLSAVPRFFPAESAAKFASKHEKRDELSTSGFVMYLGVAKQYESLDHHNIFFSDDYPSEFRQIFEEHRPADDPTIYVAVNSRRDPAHAPHGCDNWFVLVNAPPLDPRHPVNWSDLRERYGARILDRLERRFGFDGLASQIRVQRFFTPADFETRDLAQGGALYGFASHSRLSAFRRPPIQPREMENFFFVGGTTHPGGGLPLVCLSGKIVAERIQRKLANRG
jgi:phytoene desaturase